MSEGGLCATFLTYQNRSRLVNRRYWFFCRALLNPETRRPETRRLKTPAPGTPAQTLGAFNCFSKTLCGMQASARSVIWISCVNDVDAASTEDPAFRASDARGARDTFA